MNFNKFNMLLRLGREFGHDKIRNAGFSDTEHAICTFLSFHDQVSQDTIAAALLIDKTTVAKALRNMERKALITRQLNEQNRRQNIIRITDAGRSSVANHIDIYDQWLDTVCACLDENEQRQFDAYFDRIVAQALKMRQDMKNKEKPEDTNGVLTGEDIHELI